MFILAFFMLMKKEIASGKKKNLLHKKILNKELSYQQFEHLFNEFRSNLQYEDISFYDSFHWFIVDNSIVFAGTPDAEKKRFSVGTSVQPRFLLTESELIVKLNVDQNDIYNVNDSYFCFVKDSCFCISQRCWPVWKWKIPIDNHNVPMLKHYVPMFISAICLSLQDFE